MTRSQRFIRISVAVALLIAAVGRPLTAQSLRGTVRDSVSRQPIAGAVVMLLDSSGAVLRRNITDERGQYRIALRGGARTLRFIRIGLQPRELRLPPAPDDGTLVDLAMLPVSTMLSSIQVEDRSECPRRKDEIGAFGLWEQARAGLLATVVAREANPASMKLLVFERRLEGFSDRIAAFTVDLRTAEGSNNSFNASFSAKTFISSGFAIDNAGTQLVFAPDADVLLDEAFAAAYCFRIAEPSRARPRQVGLAFTPARRQQDRVDIDGTLWVDTAARALADIEFRYVGLPDYTLAFKPGGRIAFRQMPNGIVLIDQWQIRTVSSGPAKLLSSGDVVTRNDLSPLEFGGELASASWAGGVTWHASLGKLRVHTATSSGKPVAGAVIGLKDTHYRGTSNANGDTEIADLIPGPYSVLVTDPRVAELGIATPTHVTFTAARDSTFETTITPRTAEAYVMDRCVEAHQWTPGESMFILGRVVTSSGAPVFNARVSYATKKGAVDWIDLREHYTTGSDGTFQECSRFLGFGSVLRVRVQRPAMVDMDTVMTLGTKLTVLSIRVPNAP
jgi:hypothetical protein